MLADVKLFYLLIYTQTMCVVLLKMEKAVFPNATVYAHEREADYWLNPASEKQCQQTKRKLFGYC